jgi:hypothetical protein
VFLSVKPPPVMSKVPQIWVLGPSDPGIWTLRRCYLSMKPSPGMSKPLRFGVWGPQIRGLDPQIRGPGTPNPVILSMKPPPVMSKPPQIRVLGPQIRGLDPRKWPILTPFRTPIWAPRDPKYTVLTANTPRQRPPRPPKKGSNWGPQGQDPKSGPRREIVMF